MAEEFQLEGGNWWENNTSTSSRNRFDSGSSSTPTTSTSAITTNYSSNWPTQTDHVEDIKPKAFLDSVSVSQSSNHDGRGGGGGGDGGEVLSSHDPNFQIMGLGLTSHQPHEWNHQSLLTSLSSKQPPLPPPVPPLPPPHSQLHFSNNTPFWNASAASMNDVPSSLFPSNLHNIPQLPNNTTVDEKAKNMGEVRDINRITSKKGSSTETSNKRARNETSSHLPPFKVRKEKLGDRITALQQLVSPFGKTDTASVLSEAIEYIKFLHDQIGALSAPYMKSGASMQHQQSRNKSEDVGEGRSKDLRNQGLCLVPISSTFPITHETTVDLWTPNTFVSTFR
ncbi:transcription factor bHLH123-like isoform X2 [Solanum dulcamara]|uniref:transcription factor bHLH123-like isoform X2 n=1 Tax=Solanum dulcamara TaxID=45834 RepID=UPI002485F726|nr:transcription factor bHLH123-like isoform X2 [Solanum dulcamara]